MKKKYNYSFQKFLLIALFLQPLFKESLTSIVLIALLLLTIFNIIKTKKINSYISFWICTIPFFILIFSYLIHFTIDYKIKHITHALTFSLIPFIFFNSTIKFNKSFIYSACNTFMIGCTIVIFYYLFYSCSQYSISELIKIEYGTMLFRKLLYTTPIFNIHPTYLSIWLVFLCCFTLIRILEDKKYLYIPFYTLFVILIIILSSKICFLLFILSSLLILLFVNIPKRNKFLIGGSGIALLICFLFLVPQVNSRFNELFNSINSQPYGEQYDSTNVRKAILYCDWQLIQKHFLLGMGSSKIQDSLNNCYNYNFDSDFFLKNNYGTHNYFIYIILSGGILALLCFLFYWIYLFYKAYKTKSLLFFLFLFQVLVVCFTEDFLYRHFGIVYFNTFLSLFLCHFNNEYLNSDNKLLHSKRTK